MLTMRIAKTNDISYIMELMQQAKVHLKKLGVDQWQKGYPDTACIEGDIHAKNGYLLAEDDKTAGYACIDFNGEPCYADLNGQWKSIQSYAVVHRFMIDDNCKGKGYAAAAFQAVENLCRQRGIHSIKVDTDSGNLTMRHILQKNGFEYCGTIVFDNSEKIAFEKLVDA